MVVSLLNEHYIYFSSTFCTAITTATATNIIINGYNTVFLYVVVVVVAVSSSSISATILMVIKYNGARGRLRLLWAPIWPLISFYTMLNEIQFYIILINSDRYILCCSYSRVHLVLINFALYISACGCLILVVHSTHLSKAVFN